MGDHARVCPGRSLPIAVAAALVVACASEVPDPAGAGAEDATADIPIESDAIVDRDVDEATDSGEATLADPALDLGDATLADPAADGATDGSEPDSGRGGDAIVVIAAGDIAKCSTLGYLGLVRDPHELTADLVLAYPSDTPIITLGDHVYSDGSSLEFATCYSKSWGPFAERTHPCPGNHDYKTDDAEPYFELFGRRAGDPDRGYYSVELGGWRLISLNSNCHEVGGCGVGSPQHDWLVRELAADDSTCTVATWHHPRWSSDRAGNSDAMEPFVQALYDADADLVLVGHAHSYERFAPLTPQGDPDEVRGIRQFVVGTGGANLRPAVREQAISELFLEEHGVMELTLSATGYAWRFIDVDGDVRDSGAESCH